LFRSLSPSPLKGRQGGVEKNKIKRETPSVLPDISPLSTRGRGNGIKILI